MCVSGVSGRRGSVYSGLVALCRWPGERIESWWRRLPVLVLFVSAVVLVCGLGVGGPGWFCHLRPGAVAVCGRC